MEGSRRNSSMSRDFPIPGPPHKTTHWGTPRAEPLTSLRNEVRDSLRPMNAPRGCLRLTSERCSAPILQSTLIIGKGAVRPFTRTFATSVVTKNCACGPSVSSLTSTSSAWAIAERRPAIFGALPVSSNRPSSRCPGDSKTRPEWTPECRVKGDPSGCRNDNALTAACKSSAVSVARLPSFSRGSGYPNRARTPSPCIRAMWPP